MGFFDFLFGSTKNVAKVMEPSDENIFPVASTDISALKEEYSVEINDMYPMESYHYYASNGIELIRDTKSIHIIYEGLLAKSGAQEVHAAVGYGNNLKWEDIDDYTLHKLESQTFELILPVKRAGNINIAFKDNAGNWDNNSGMNYCFDNQFQKFLDRHIE
ncbi:MAG: hypothetical protein AB7G87_02210 [Clostridia bacterium]